LSRAAQKRVARKLLAFLDAGCPDSVGQTFKVHKHGVTCHRDVLPEKTPDEIVCLTGKKA
jgi:hypothetical protein